MEIITGHIYTFDGSKIDQYEVVEKLSLSHLL